MKINNTGIIIELAARTDKGLHREGNEDNFIVTEDYSNREWVLPAKPYDNRSAGTILVIADGMGGLKAGEVASKIAVAAIQEYFTGLMDNGDLKQHLLNAIANANNAIVYQSQESPETKGMGTTIVAAVIKESEMHVAWVGDSRCYIWRQSNLLQVTKDHSHIQNLIDTGKLTKERAFDHPDSNIITQSLGDNNRKPKPDYECCHLYNGDIVLLCSDGLNGMLRDEQIEQIIAEGEELPKTAARLIDAANEHGGVDNTTVIMAKVLTGPAVEKSHSTEMKKRSPLIYVLILLLIGLSLALFFIWKTDIRIDKPGPPNDTIKHSLSKRPTSIPSKPAKKDSGLNEVREKINAIKKTAHPHENKQHKISPDTVKRIPGKAGTSTASPVPVLIPKDTTQIKLLK